VGCGLYRATTERRPKNEAQLFDDACSLGRTTVVNDHIAPALTPGEKLHLTIEQFTKLVDQFCSYFPSCTCGQRRAATRLSALWIAGLGRRAEWSTNTDILNVAIG
jgi:hypothetical protein